MQFLGFDTSDGSWGGYGTSGYWYASGAYVSLPAGITSITGSTTTPVSLGAAGDARRMAYPGGAGTMELCYSADAADVAVTASGAIDYILSVRYCAVAADRTSILTLRSPDGATVYATSPTSPDFFLGVWARFRVTGSCRIRAVGTYPRYQGLLIDPYVAASPGRLLCLGSGADGLAYIS